MRCAVQISPMINCKPDSYLHYCIQEAPKTETPKPSKARKNVFARLFAPTATFLARMAGKGPSGAKETMGKTDTLRQSMMDKILNSPAVSGRGEGYRFGADWWGRSDSS